MNGEISIPQAAIDKLAEVQSDSLLAQQANATPLPGPLRNAFAVKNSIDVGDYKIRAVVDRDFEYLQQLDNPLHYQLSDKGKEIDMITLVRGQHAWDLCYLFTHPFKEVKAVLKSGGVAKLRELSGDEFDEFDVCKMLEVLKAIYRQIEIYWEPVISFKSSDTDDSKKNILADGADNPPMALVSSTKNDA